MAVRRRNKISFPVMLLVAVGVAFILIRFASLQMQLGREENELAQIQEKVKAQTVENKELERLIAMGDDEEYQKRIAMEQLNFAYSDEKIYIDISGN
ncbi:MAG: septum formation initiator family protein [Oscillospiraceae bacterium]|nr:septum formation initiator family protein [Oscillospiraceae bacterium]